MTTQPEGGSPFFSIPELWEANDRKVGVNKLRELARSKHLRTVRVGRRILVPKTELARLPEILADSDDG